MRYPTTTTTMLAKANGQDVHLSRLFLLHLRAEKPAEKARSAGVRRVRPKMEK
jgi:hypothetical protein